MLLHKFGLLALGASAMATSVPSGNKDVDNTSTRTDWVTSYKPNNNNVDGLDGHAGLHWVPLGLDYLRLDYSPVHHEHLITLTSGTKIMQWDGLSGFVNALARFLHL